MKILAFDTSTTICVVALYDSDKPQPIVSIQQFAPMQQGKLILPLIDQLLLQSKTTLAEIDLIAYGRGPGSFTGLRIACSVAQALHFAANIPVVSLSSLAILAQSLHLKHAANRVMVALDARMNAIYWGLFNTNPNLTLLGEEILSPPAEISVSENDLTNENAEDTYAVGDGWVKYSQILLKRLSFQPKWVETVTLPLGEAMILLAKSCDQDNHLSSSQIIPNYLR